VEKSNLVYNTPVTPPQSSHQTVALQPVLHVWQSQADGHTMELAYYRNGNARGVVNEYEHVVQATMVEFL